MVFYFLQRHKKSSLSQIVYAFATKIKFSNFKPFTYKS